MPKGLKVPMQQNASGGMAMVEGDENNHKIISLGLSDTDNQNAYQQDEGIGRDMIFELNDEVLRGLLGGRVDLLFQRFELQKRFKLLPDTVQWTDKPKEQELKLEFRYVDLESEEEKSYSRNFKAGE